MNPMRCVVAWAAALLIVAMASPAAAPLPAPSLGRSSLHPPVASPGAWEINASLLGTSPVDLNNDGKADYLQIHIGLGIDRGAMYILQLALYTGYGGLANAYRAQPLPAGSSTVELDVSGIAISRFDQDGPWYITFDVDRVDWNNTQVFDALWTTPAYMRSQFDSLPVARLTINTTFVGCTAVDCGPILVAYDPSNGFEYWASPNTRNLLLLYNGTFEVLVYMGAQAFNSVVRQVVMNGDAFLTLTINQAPADAVLQTYDASNLSAIRAATRYTWYSNAPQFRWWADLFGNHDGVANATELANLQGFMVPYGYGPSSLPLTLDARSAVAADVSRATLDGAAPVTSTAPINATGSSVLAFKVQATQGGVHNLTLRLPHVGPSFSATYVVTLPENVSAGPTEACPGQLSQVGPNEWSFAAGAPTPSAACGPVSPIGRSTGQLSFVMWSSSGGSGVLVLPALVLSLVAGACAAMAIFFVWRRRRMIPPQTGP